MLHHLESDGFERGEAQEEFGEPLRRDWVDALGACLKALQDLLLVDFDLLSGGRAESFGVCREEHRDRE